MRFFRWFWLLLLMGAGPYRQPEIVPENLPPGLRPPEANFGPDGGIVFPLDQRGLKAAVEQAMPQLQLCADNNPGLYHQAVLRIHVVATDGGDQATIETVRIVNGSSPQQFESCALSVLNGLRFEHPSGDNEYIVDYPISFAPPDAGVGL